MPLFRRIARRGFSNYPFKKVFQVVNVSDLNRFADGDTVNPESLTAKGLARKKGVRVKILGSGELTRKLVVEGATVSASAREKIVAMGGEVKEGAASAQAESKGAAEAK
jgi:large subunit ribosomal protein L15